MTVAHDAHTKSATWTTTPDPFTFDHTPSGTPRGVIVEITVNADAGADKIDGVVSYGSVAMARVATGFASDTAGEPGSAYIYYLGSGIPTGIQPVSINYNPSPGGTKQAVCITVTAAADTTEATSNKISGDAANPQIALDSGADSALRYFVINSGLPNVTDLTLVASMSTVDSTDHGARVTRFDRQTTAASGSVTVGYTSASDDVAMIAIALKEVAAVAVIPKIIQKNVSIERSYTW